jgi:uncharacterized protein (TIGR00730 family)
MAQLKSLCVYCGSSTGHDPRFRQAAKRLGALMAERGVTLVYGGGQIGLMGVLADAVLSGGGRVLGIIPEHLDRREVGHRGASELRIVESMHVRKNMMFEEADAFVSLPGGCGTLDETFEMLTWRQIGLHDKPIVLVNIAGYWDPLLDLLHHAVAQGFAGRATLDYLTVVDEVDQVFPAIERQPEPMIEEQPQRL